MRDLRISRHCIHDVGTLKAYCTLPIYTISLNIEIYFCRENPIYGLENDASVSSAGQKWDNQLFYDVALNNGESAV